MTMLFQSYVFLLVMTWTSSGRTDTDDAYVLTLSQDKIRGVLSDLVLHTTVDCFLGNRSAGKLETAASITEHIHNTKGKELRTLSDGRQSTGLRHS